MSQLADLRKSYERAELSEDASHADPLRQFEQWLNEAISAQLPEPNAMTLATVDPSLRPSTRVVLIKGYDEAGITWFTNYESRKGRELAANPWAALQFHWVELERVVRIEGRVAKVSETESDAYFASRPLDSRIGAWASPQSQVIAGRSGAAWRSRQTVVCICPDRPMAATSWGWIADWASASRVVLNAASIQIAGSCSAQPSRGVARPYSRRPTPSRAPAASMMTALAPDVPMSRPSM